MQGEWFSSNSLKVSAIHFFLPALPVANEVSLHLTRSIHSFIRHQSIRHNFNTLPALLPLTGATHKKAPQQAHISPLPPTPTKQKIKSATPASFTANSALSTPVYAAANDSSRMPPRSKRGAQSTSGWRSARGSTAVTPRYAAGQLRRVFFASLYCSYWN